MLRTLRRSLPLAVVLVVTACGPTVLHVDDLSLVSHSGTETVT